MSKFAWCSDIHLDSLRLLGGAPDEKTLIKFSESLVAKDDPTSIIISGDISNSSELIYHLSVMERVVQRPIYFVLGNHDFWGSSFDAVRAQLKEVERHSHFLRYLTHSSYIQITPATALVGHDGWYDAGYGDWRRSSFMMYDWYKIHDFIPDMGASPTGGKAKDAIAAVVARSRSLAEAAANHVATGIKSALRYHKSIIINTHMPPFEKAHIYRGVIGAPDAQPWYTSKVMGDMILDAARSNPTVRFTVLSGHTHGEFNGRIASNVYCHVAGAEYGSPCLAKLIEVA